MSGKKWSYGKDKYLEMISTKGTPGTKSRVIEATVLNTRTGSGAKTELKLGIKKT